MPDDLAITSRIVIPGSDLEVSYSRAGGPGGQKVNKTESRVQLSFDFEDCEALTFGVKARVRASWGSRITRDGRMVLALPTDVLFASGKAKLSDAGKAAVTEVTAVLVTLHKRRFQVEGHTDNVPIKTHRYNSNWQLAAARALNVVEAMMEAGMTGARISAAAFGEYRPVAGNDSDAGKAQNRRIEIVMEPDLSSLPGFNELKAAMDGK